MIIEIYELENRIEAVKFNKGANVIVTSKGTINSLEEGILLKVVYFLLGAEIESLELSLDLIKDYTFGMKLVLVGEQFTITRSIEDYHIINVSGQISVLPIAPVHTKVSGLYSYSLSQWKKVLELTLFRTSSIFDSQPSDTQLLSPSFKAGPFLTPFDRLNTYLALREHVNHAFLLGLEWNNSIETNASPIQSDNIQLDNPLNSDRLCAEKLNLEQSIKKDEKELLNYQVHPKYTSLLEQADSITEEIHQRNNEMFLLVQKLNRYEESIVSKTDSQAQDIMNLYKEADIDLGLGVKKTLEQAQEFHQSLYISRAEFLKNEIEDSKEQLEQLTREKEVLSIERSEIMKVLDSSKALEEYYHFQRLLLKKKTELAELNNLIARAQISKQYSANGMVDVLIEDLHNLDNVDKHQVAKALQLANQKAVDKSFQYICLLSSEQCPF